jgi:hypothetical protein
MHLMATGAIGRYDLDVKAWCPLEWMLGRRVKLKLDLLLGKGI